VLNSWDLKNRKLPPRNHFIQYYVSNSTELHCHIYSCKLNIETQFQHDILYYSLLLLILSNKSNLTPKSITFSFGEIYTPIVNLNNSLTVNLEELIVLTKESIKHKNFIEMTSSDFTFILLK
jgi:thymidylate synthase